LAKFRSKIVEIEAFCYGCEPHPNWFTNYHPLIEKTYYPNSDRVDLKVKSNHGWVQVEAGDFIIVGDGELYPCKAEVFHKKYEEIF